MITKKFLKKWWLYIVFILSILILYITAGYMSVPDANKDAVFYYLFEDIEGKKVTVNFMISFAQLLFAIVFVKVFLAQRIFLEAIYEHFKTIFVEKPVISIYNTDELTKIAKLLDAAHQGINISYLEDRQNSLSLIEHEWSSNKLASRPSFIITDYQNTDTVYNSKNFEIKHKKIFFKMMNNNIFSYQYYFIPFDKIVILVDYEDNKDNRWEEKSFKCMSKRINSKDENLEIKTDFSIDRENGKDWIKINFVHKSDRYRKLRKGDEFFIEFSVSSPIDLSNTQKAIERREEYFKTSYQKPCAVKTVKFQIETYDDNDLTMEPIIKINDEPVRKIPSESIYYKTWSWNFYYCDTKEQNIDISIKKD